MARIEELMGEIEGFFGRRTTSISAMYFLKKYFYLLGGLVGLVAGALLRELAVFFIIGLMASVAVYFYAENYLLKIDHEFFSSPGHSKRDIFDKYYASEVGRRLSLRMTESEELVKNAHLSTERARAVFQERLAVELDREFRRSDWRMFIAESLHYQKK
jgi:hypothetical protein